MWNDVGGIPWDQKWPDFEKAKRARDGHWETQQMETFKKNMLGYDLPDRRGIFVLPKSEEFLKDPKDSYGPNVSLQQIDLSKQKTPEELHAYKNWKCTAHLSACDRWIQQRNKATARMTAKGKAPEELARKIARKTAEEKKRRRQARRAFEEDQEERRRERKAARRARREARRETRSRDVEMGYYVTPENERKKAPPPGVNRITWNKFLRFVTPP